MAAIVVGCASDDDGDDASQANAAATSTSTTIAVDDVTNEAGEAATIAIETDVEDGSGDDEPTTTETSTTTTTLIPNTTVEPGDITESVPAQVQETAPPAALDESVESESGISASIVQVESIETEAHLPGEIGGPGVAITIELANQSSQPIDIGNVVVDLVQSNGTSATPISTGTESFAGDLASGNAATATYVFTIDSSLRSDVTILLTYSADEPIVVFTGSIA